MSDTKSACIIIAEVLLVSRYDGLSADRKLSIDGTGTRLRFDNQSVDGLSRRKKERPEGTDREIAEDVLDKVLASYQKPEDITGENGLLKRFTKALVEQAMEAPLTTHRGDEKQRETQGHYSSGSKSPPGSTTRSALSTAATSMTSWATAPRTGGR